jgi:hypothetical protein
MQTKWVREPHILAIITVGTAALSLLLAMSPTAPVTAQTTTSATNTTTPTTAVTNFTKLLSQNKEFQTCISPTSGIRGECFPSVDVLYQSPTTLVLKSRYVDTIWKVVDLAKKEGYKIDGISTYITTFQNTGTVNALVVMSRGR